MQETVEVRSEFPHLTTKEFERACIDLNRRYHRRDTKQDDWRSVEVVRSFDTTYMRITKELQRGSRVVESSEDGLEEDDVAEDDEEALHVVTSSPAVVHYDVVLSPVYRVPVLYFSISDPQHRYPPTMDTLYEHLIPRQFKAQTESGGVIGGVSVNVRKYKTHTWTRDLRKLGSSSLKSPSVFHSSMPHDRRDGSQRRH
jgi:ubiquitin-like-conjugating enzyme ATG10